MHAGVYTLGAVYVRVFGVYTNTAPVDAYRGAGRPEANYVVERLVDVAARETGLGPVEIRKRNFIPASAMPFTTVLGATYDSGDDWIGTLQHIAREGCCWVIGSGTVLRASDLPADFPSRDALYPDADEWINDGDSVVVAPGGKIVAGPMRRETGILYADVSIDAVVAAKRRIDVAGHYARPDVFQLHVNRQRQAPVTFD